ncbi:MAG TPA: DUF1638 domain-containing protein [Candidatus Limnocylindrales bacterium]|nr:DUF1638 domain-containing protein [Candidatus Limnocylindrales bacterium]
MRIHAIACDVMARPVYLAAARSPHVVDVRLFERGLHADPRDLRTRLQEAIDEAPASAEVVVLGYGLCGGATAGIEARRVPVVLPRAHDCITLFLGARERYEAETAGQATYWYVADQLERTDGVRPGAGSGAGGLGGDTDDGIEAVRAAYVATYGEDNADYLMEVMGAWKAHYGRGAFIAMGVTDEAGAEARAREQAERRGWAFERVEGDMVLIRRLLHGDWDAADMLVLQPGERLAMSYDDGVVKAVPAG